MSTKYPGGVIKSSPVVPAGPYQNSSASGVWTMEQAGYWIKQGNWPTAGNFNNRLYSWGTNATGNLGLGNITNYSSPKQVGALTTWLTLACGTYSSHAIKLDGTLWSWGTNGNGQLGLNNTTSYSSPKQVGALTTWSKLGISSGSAHVLALKTDGTLWAWGYNGFGQLGLGTVGVDKSSPTQVGALTTWSTISASDGHSMAIKTNGTLWSWGRNNNGQLGLGNTTNYSSPKQVGALTNWSKVSINGTFSTAVKTDGTLWTWGNNSQGELGLGNTTYYSSPKQVGALTTWSSTSAGAGLFTLAIKTDGTLWSWGYNAYGELGLGNIDNRSSPVQVGALTTWLNIAGGYSHTIATKTDGTLWSWGRGTEGQLGLGNTTNRSSPVQVGALTTWSSTAAGYRYTIAILS